MEQASLLQVVFGILTVASAMLVIFASNPVFSALFLMLTLFLTGGLYIGMGALFVGAAQILIYAGAIAVLFVFLVMLLDLVHLKISIPGQIIKKTLAFFGFVIMLVPMVSLITRGVDNLTSKSGGTLESISAHQISHLLLSKYMIPFQLAGLLLLGAVMGAVVFGKTSKREDV